MKLTLTQGYPHPYPAHLPQDEQDKINEEARGVFLVINGVKSFEMKFTMTIEFVDAEHYESARNLGFLPWYDNIVEAVLSREDGYDHPAFIVGDKAYCGFILGE